MIDAYISRESWPDYRINLLPVIERAAERNRHKFAEQVDKALSDERAFLFLIEDGFFVLRPIVDDNNDIHNEVMFAYCWGGTGVNTYQPLVEEMTRMIEGKSVIAYTTLKPLGRLMLAKGYRLDSKKDRVMKWVKEL